MTAKWVALCAKEFSDLNLLIKQLLANYYFFTKLPKVSHGHNFFKHMELTEKYNFLDQLLLPYKFHGSSISGMLFFASCEPLISNKLSHSVIKSR